MTTRAHKTQGQFKEVKPKHRPSTTPTGLPGDELKPLYRKKRGEKLGEVVDTLVVPEYKAARRLIRRFQRRNPEMASGSNMTLYERIMAYRLLKQKGVVGGESKDDMSEEDPRKIERSDTGWGSVDISQYTNKKDSDDNRSPTPPPTLTHPVGGRRLKQVEDDGPLITARDVHVQLDDKLNDKKERITPIRNNNSKNRRTPTPGRDRTSSGNSLDRNRLPVLPPIQTSHQEIVTDVDGNCNDHVDKRGENDVRNNKREENIHVEEKNEEQLTQRHQVDKAKEVILYESRRERIHEDDLKRNDNVRNEVRNDNVRKEVRNDNVRKEVRNDNVRKEVRNDNVRNEERNDVRVNVKDDSMLQKRNKSIDKDDITESGKMEEINNGENYGNLRDSLADEAVLVAAGVTQYTRQPSEDGTKSVRQPKPRTETSSGDTTPSPHQSKSGTEPLLKKSNSRESPLETKQFSQDKPEKSRHTPKRRTSMDDVIDHLDKMVDRDLNEIIQSLGSKERKPGNDELEEKLKQKILDAKFQSDMDNYLRDI